MHKSDCITKGSTIAFVGQSGAGKTTIANLICLLLKPTKGNIFIDDHHINGEGNRIIATFISNILN